MRKIFWCALCLASMCTPPLSAVQEAKKQVEAGTLRVWVILSENGQESGLEGFNVRAVRQLPDGAPQRFNSRSDQAGMCEFLSLPPAEYTAVFLSGAQSDLFEPGGRLFQYYCPSALDRVLVQAGKATELRVVVRLGASVEGRAVDSDGESLADAVWLAYPANLGSKAGKVGMTGPNGEFHARGVDTEQECVVMVCPKGYDYGLKVRIPKGRLKAGESCDASTITFRKKSGRPNVKGTIHDVEGGDGCVMYLFDEGQGSFAYVTPTNGGYSLEVPPGNYVLTSELPDGVSHGNPYEAYRAELSIAPGDVKKVDVALSRKKPKQP